MRGRKIVVACTLAALVILALITNYQQASGTRLIELRFGSVLVLGAAAFYIAGLFGKRKAQSDTHDHLRK